MPKPSSEDFPKSLLITYEDQLSAAGQRWNGFKRSRDDLSDWIDRRFTLSSDLPTSTGHQARAGLRIVRNQEVTCTALTTGRSWSGVSSDLRESLAVGVRFRDDTIVSAALRGLPSAPLP